jgi:hypothetical protein
MWWPSCGHSRLVIMSVCPPLWQDGKASKRKVGSRQSESRRVARPSVAVPYITAWKEIVQLCAWGVDRDACAFVSLPVTSRVRRTRGRGETEGRRLDPRWTRLVEV